MPGGSSTAGSRFAGFAAAWTRSKPGRGSACGCAPLFLITAAIPFVPSAVLAIGGVCLGLFACQCVVGSLNIMPVDLLGPGRAAFSMSLLACSYSLMQMFVSPLIGASVDRFGFCAAVAIASLLPLVGFGL